MNSLRAQFVRILAAPSFLQVVRGARRAPAPLRKIQKTEDQGGAGQQPGAGGARQHRNEYVRRGHQESGQLGRLLRVPAPGGGQPPADTWLQSRVLLGKFYISLINLRKLESASHPLSVTNWRWK